MKISDLIECLESCKEELGDIPVFHKELTYQKCAMVVPEFDADDIDYSSGDTHIEEGIYI